MASRNPFASNDHDDPDAHAPEAVGMLSPITPQSNLENELQAKYQSARSSERQPPPPRPADSEKEVVNLEHDSALKHVVPLELTSEYPETATVTSPRTTDADTLKARSTSDAAPEALPPGGQGRPSKGPRILGMSKKAFLILVAVTIIVVAAAVGGGVGGAVASSKKPDATPASASSSTPAATTSGAAPSQTVQFLSNQTWPQGYAFAFQGFSRPNFTGAATRILTGDGGASAAGDFDFDVHSYVWVPNIGNCCVNFCANATRLGYIGYRCTPVRKNESSEAVARAFVWCDDTHSDAIAEAKGCS
ncbi:hypothetical protein H634G_02489 [Metarhizium anisopliae BRIP 53293]|uniref:Uncharacterized protein n=1 Tax=Metarhizium anisopliae BRIP 53293 TaxID=1291518 RepID=A0A0D9PBV4_METAN|nr:hypothetical protein H634G_02489 [Metarhizium anisopliae BRIP 53293]KJK92219.1 hypothetical protein H633G_03896 [Metarhizium anisopliae BRIP 53284]